MRLQRVTRRPCTGNKKRSHTITGGGRFSVLVRILRRVSLYLLRGRVHYPVKRVRLAVAVGTRLELARLTAIFLPGVAGLVRLPA